MTDAEIVEMVLRHEGVWDDNPADRGGRTAYGISSRFHPEAWANGSPTREHAIAIYLADYVAPFASVEPELKPQVVDIAVTSGVTTARALYSVAKANHGTRSVNTQLVVERLKHFARIVRARPTNSVFLLGWVNRAVSFLSILFVLVLSGCASAPYVPDRPHPTPERILELAAIAAPPIDVVRELTLRVYPAFVLAGGAVRVTCLLPDDPDFRVIGFGLAAVRTAMRQVDAHAYELLVTSVPCGDWTAYCAVSGNGRVLARQERPLISKGQCNDGGRPSPTTK